jgi:hypothetical protein
VPFVKHHIKSDAQCLPNRQIGVEVVCGDIDEVWLFHTDEYVGGGSNLIVEVIRQVFLELKIRLALKGYSLPKTAYFQFDNCGENKNKTVLSYLSMLTELKYFDLIELYFLIVGHTHTSLDQFFSVLSKILYNTKFVGSVASMKNLLLQAHSEEGDRATTSKHIPVVNNVRESWESCIADIKHHQVPHCFMFTRGPTGEAVMQYKLYSTQEYRWLPIAPARDGPAASVAEMVVPDHPLVGGYDAFTRELDNSLQHEAANFTDCFREAEAQAQTNFYSDCISESSPIPTAPRTGQSPEVEGYIKLLLRPAIEMQLFPVVVDPMKLKKQVGTHVQVVCMILDFYRLLKETCVGGCTTGTK